MTGRGNSTSRNLSCIQASANGTGQRRAMDKAIVEKKDIPKASLAIRLAAL